MTAEAEANAGLKATIRQLIGLQEIDAQIVALEARRDQIPLQIEAQVRAVQKAERALEGVQKKALDLRKTIDQRNLDVKSYDEKIHNSKVKLNDITTNDAYKAMLSQIAGFETDRGRVEEDILELSYKLDEMQPVIDSAKKDVDAAKREHDVRQKELQTEAGTQDEKIDALKAKRGEFTTGLVPDAADLYERVSRIRKGNAIAPVRDSHCQGCMMNLTLQEVSKLTACKELVACRTCSRMLYLPEALDR